MGSLPRGLRVHRVPGKPLRREEDGRYALHLWLQQDGRFDGDLALRMSPAEAELLHAQLCFALADAPVTTRPADTPDCRRVGGSRPEPVSRP
ncbi:hypothetical protein RM572_13115 [Streptomyces sp. DSM 42041]|uniref:Uncharacterized protein n=1 Tax=Streptomyces hazeniae TaxID=3075538 RepID=A0ABU2NRV1_9ACTN|nr:hypothetical protein [Streptomyces sp. DSM 42041]MDT0379708.1 hypothetical protein [Streptomyces sp. DSM 42041]